MYEEQFKLNAAKRFGTSSEKTDPDQLSIFNEVKVKVKKETEPIKGRHDPCIALRVVSVVEAVCGLVILDLWEVAYGIK